MTSGIGPLGAFAGPLARFALFGRRQIDARSASLGKANGDRLLGRAGPVFPLTNVLDFLADKFARLCGGRFSFPLVLACSLDGFLFWHGSIPPLIGDPGNAVSEAR